MKAKDLICLAACATLAGCGTPWPLEPVYDPIRLKAQSNGRANDYSDIDSVKSIAFEWQKEMGEATRDRRKQEILVADIVFYGTILLTGGQAWLAKSAGSTTALHVRNVGLGTAVGAGLFGNHYTPKGQRLAFSKAEERMACLNRALNPVPSAEQWSAFQIQQDAFKDLTDKAMEKSVDLAGLYVEVPKQALEYIETYVLPNLKAELAEVSLATPSREEIISAAQKYKEQKEAGASAVASAANATPQTSKPASDSNALITESEEDRKARQAREKKEKQLTLMRQAAGIQAIASFSSALSLCKTR